MPGARRHRPSRTLPCARRTAAKDPLPAPPRPSPRAARRCAEQLHSQLVLTRRSRAASALWQHDGPPACAPRAPGLRPARRSAAQRSAAQRSLGHSPASSTAPRAEPTHQTHPPSGAPPAPAHARRAARHTFMRGASAAADGAAEAPAPSRPTSGSGATAHSPNAPRLPVPRTPPRPLASLPTSSTQPAAPYPSTLPHRLPTASHRRERDPPRAATRPPCPN